MPIPKRRALRERFQFLDELVHPPEVEAYVPGRYVELELYVLVVFPYVPDTSYLASNEMRGITLASNPPVTNIPTAHVFIFIELSDANIVGVGFDWL